MIQRNSGKIRINRQVADSSLHRHMSETWLGHSKNMIRMMNTWRTSFADYTVGTVIVMVHMITADRRS